MLVAWLKLALLRIRTRLRPAFSDWPLRLRASLRLRRLIIPLRPYVPFGLYFPFRLYCPLRPCFRTRTGAQIAWLLGTISAQGLTIGDLRPLLLDWRMHCRSPGNDRSAVGGYFRMWNHSRTRHLRAIDAHDLTLNRLSATEDTRGNSSHSDLAIYISIVGDIDVRDVGDVRHVTNIYVAQIPIAVVIPREEGLTRAERKPRNRRSCGNSDREPTAANKSYQRRGVHRPNRDYRLARNPSPA